MYQEPVRVTGGSSLIVCCISGSHFLNLTKIPFLIYGKMLYILYDSQALLVKHCQPASVYSSRAHYVHEADWPTTEHTDPYILRTHRHYTPGRAKWIWLRYLKPELPSWCTCSCFLSLKAL